MEEKFVEEFVTEFVNDMVLKSLQSLHRHRHLTKLFTSGYTNFTTLSPPECTIRSTIELCRRVEDLKPLTSQLIVNGLIDYKLVISVYVEQCFDVGSPELALSTFNISRNRSLLLQNSLIKRLSNLGLYQDVIFVYKKCHLSGCTGGDYTFPYVIKACSILKDVRLGKEIHSVVLRTGYTSNVIVQTAMVDFYAKIGLVDVARQVFDEMPEWDVVSWNALISGYTLNGLDCEALDVFCDICVKGVKPNAGTLASIVPVCTRLRLMSLGECLHGYALKYGFDQDGLLTPALISMHANVGDICAAQCLFEFSLTKNLVIWNSMIYAYTQNQNTQRAFEMFSADLRPNIVTFVSVIPCCEQMNSIRHGECLHGNALKCGLDTQVSVATALTSMYSKLGHMDSAINIFTQMPQKNQLTWNAIISGYVHHGLFHRSLDAVCEMQLAGFEPDSISIINVLSACSGLESLVLGRSAHAISIRRDFSDINVSNVLLAFYSKCNQHHSSWRLFDKMAIKNTISWNTMISGCVYNGEMEKATILLSKMQKGGLHLDIVTLISILPSFNDNGDLLQGMTLHGFALKFSWTSDVTLTNALISMYSNCGEPDSAALLFYCLKERSLVSWNSLITGYRRCNLHREAMFLFRQLMQSDKKPNYITLLNVLPACCTLLQGKSIHGYTFRTGAVQPTPLITSLISMYSKFKNVASCLSIFKAEEKWNISLWNSMMSALIEAGEAEKVFAVFGELLQMEVKVDYVTILSFVSACIPINSISLTKSVLAFVIRAGFLSDTAISNALIDLCAKCGDSLMAREVFDTMVNKDAVSFGVMINGYGLHWNGNAVISLFKQMENAGIQPDAITYLSALSACSHAGLTEETKAIFNSMLLHGVEPTLEHYACILDLLGRTGQLHEAYDLLKRLPGGPSVSMLESLLGACWVHGNTELGCEIGELLIQSNPEICQAFVMLHKLYAGVGRWHEADKIRTEMEERKLKKVPGLSMLEG